MSIINGTALKSNPNFLINFDGGNLSSDSGLLLLKEFYHKLGVGALLRKAFHTTDPNHIRVHKDYENLLQMLYQITAAYFQDDHADALRNDPVLTAAVGKTALASQPTLSRFHNRMDEATLAQFEEIHRILRRRVYAVECPEHILFDLELRPGAMYCCKGVAKFMKPLLDEYQTNYPKTALFLRCDSGFATNELYTLCEINGTSYAIRPKENAVLRRLAKELDSELCDLTKDDIVSHAVVYGEFEYQAGSWDYPRRVMCKIEKPDGQMLHMNTFVVTNMDSSPEDIVRFYCKRGQMENFIKESKSGFDMSYVSSSRQIVNANRIQIHALVCNLFNWFRRLTLPETLKKDRVDTIRLKLMKIACRVVRSARYVAFKLCSHCPFQTEFDETLNNIWKFRPAQE